SGRSLGRVAGWIAPCDHGCHTAAVTEILPYRCVSRTAIGSSQEDLQSFPVRDPARQLPRIWDSNGSRSARPLRRGVVGDEFGFEFDSSTAAAGNARRPHEPISRKEIPGSTGPPSGASE